MYIPTQSKPNAAEIVITLQYPLACNHNAHPWPCTFVYFYTLVTQFLMLHYTCSSTMMILASDTFTSPTLGRSADANKRHLDRTSAISAVKFGGAVGACFKFWT